MTADAAETATWTMRAECESGHSQEITIGNVDRTWAEAWAGLMDGSSPLYLRKPGPESAIGKCGICHARIRCTVRAAGEKEDTE
jgi:hypothetical protein